MCVLQHSVYNKCFERKLPNVQASFHRASPYYAPLKAMPRSRWAQMAWPSSRPPQLALDLNSNSSLKFVKVPSELPSWFPLSFPIVGHATRQVSQMAGRALGRHNWPWAENRGFQQFGFKPGQLWLRPRARRAIWAHLLAVSWHTDKDTMGKEPRGNTRNSQLIAEHFLSRQCVKSLSLFSKD